MNTTPALDGAHPAWVPTLFDLSQLLDVLSSASLQSAPGDAVSLSSLASGHGGILGAQMLGQMVMLSESRFSGMQVRTAAMRFIRRSSWERPLEARLEVHSEGRRFASATVSFVQRGVVVARGDVLLATGQRRSAPSPPEDSNSAARPAWQSAPVSARALWPWQVRQGEDGGLVTTVWSRVPIAAGDLQLSRALLVFATEPLTVPLAIDVAGERAAGGDIAQSVVSHSISFVRDLDVSCWHLHKARLAASVRGDLTGAGEVLDEQGRLAAITETVAIAEIAKRTSA